MFVVDLCFLSQNGLTPEFRLVFSHTPFRLSDTPCRPTCLHCCCMVEHSGEWLFATNYSCGENGSVVVSFNRLPALATAVSKTVGSLLCIAFFCDLITLVSTSVHLPDISFVCSHSDECRHQRNQSHYVSTAMASTLRGQAGRQQHCQLDVLGGLKCVFPKKDNINRLLCALHWLNMMFKR